MARWKSGLFPFVVFAINVNWETHKISPSISFTLAFHIVSSLAGSEKTRSERLGTKRNRMGQHQLRSQRGIPNKWRRSDSIRKGREEIRSNGEEKDRDLPRTSFWIKSQRPQQYRLS